MKKYFAFMVAGALMFLCSHNVLLATEGREDFSHSEKEFSGKRKRVTSESDPKKSKKRSKSKNTEKAEPFPPDLSRLVFVHLTDILPTNGTMIAGETLGGKCYTDSPNPRVTLHFSLNTPVAEENHTNPKIHSKKYCVLEPAEAFKESFYGGRVQDLMVIGNHTLSKNSIIFVPENDYHNCAESNTNYKGKWKTYSEGNVVDAVLDYIKNEDHFYTAGEWKKDLFFKEGDFLKPLVPNNKVIFCDGEKEKQIDHKSLICDDVLKGIYFGCHQDSPLGIMNEILTSLARVFAFFEQNKNISGEDYWRSTIAFKHLPSDLETKKALHCFDFNYDLLLNSDITAHQKGQLEEWHKSLKPWFDLINFDLELRQENCSIYWSKLTFQELVNGRNNNNYNNLIGDKTFLKKTKILLENDDDSIAFGKCCERLKNNLPTKTEKESSLVKAIALMPDDEKIKEMLLAADFEISFDQTELKYIENNKKNQKYPEEPNLKYLEKYKKENK